MRVGLDIGSTTIKCAVLDEHDALIYSTYERHYSHILEKAQELLRDKDIDESVIHAVISHGYGICIDVEPELFMEKVLFAADELTGLIGAVALMRPTGISDMEVKSVKKKFKDKKFAAGCSRDVILRGAEMCGWDLDTLIQKTLDAMRA